MRWGYPRAAITISVGNGLFDAACNMWWAFIPLYLMEVGDTSATEAVYWLAIGAMAQGFGRLMAGPVWGMLSDRYGRKIMYLRSLFFLIVTTVLFGYIAEPWQVIIALALHGIFSGYDGPAVAMLSVSVPDSHFRKSLGLFTAMRYLGQSVGPALGAVVAIAINYRATVLLSAVLTTAVFIWIIHAAPADRTDLSKTAGPPESKADEADTPAGGPDARPRLAPFRPSNQLWLAVFIFGIVVALNQVLRITTPIALRAIEGHDVAAATGMAFTLGGLASAIGVFVVSGRYFRIGRLRPAMVICSVVVGGAFLALGFTSTTAPYIAGVALVSLLQAAMIPTCNMLIAFNTSVARRGSAFGLGSGAQAIAIALGPAAAAAFVATSLPAGFAVVAAVCLALAALMHRQLREPRPEQAGT